MNIYLDTSVLVSLYVPEQHTSSITNYLLQQKDDIIISHLVETEFYSTLAKKGRTKELNLKQITAISELFSVHLADTAYQKQLITEKVFKTAIDFLQAMKTSLRTLDALHLAASKVANAKLVTADKELADSAKVFKLPVELI